MGNSVENIHTNGRVKRVTCKAKAKSNGAQTESLQLFFSTKSFLHGFLFVRQLYYFFDSDRWKK